jgi:hypothetical protein
MRLMTQNAGTASTTLSSIRISGDRHHTRRTGGFSRLAGADALRSHALLAGQGGEPGNAVEHLTNVADTMRDLAGCVEGSPEEAELAPLRH